MADLAIPTEYRSDVCARVLDTVAKGESCTLIGVGSSGKSNIARQLIRADARAFCLKDRARGMAGVLVDCLKYIDYTTQSLHRLILQALLQAAQTPDAPPALAGAAPELEQLWDRATETESADRVRDTLERAINLVFQRGVNQMFIVLDDFDNVLMHAPAQALNSLRGLRDNHKNRLMYVAVTRREMDFIRPEREYEDFAELVAATPIPAGMYSYNDAIFAVNRLAQRWGLDGRMREPEKRRVLELSGSHPGLLKAIMMIVNQDERFDLMAGDVLFKLSGHKDTEPECEKIWDSLDEDEHAALIAVANRDNPPSDDLRRLTKKELVRQRVTGEYAIFSPIFADFVLRQMTIPAGVAQVDLDPKSNTVRIDGRAIRNFDQIEYELFAAVYDRRGQPVTMRDLLGVILSHGSGRGRFSGPPEQRLERYMEEVMSKVNRPGRTYIVSAPDRTYRFKESEA
jgi:hypothetical protein